MPDARLTAVAPTEPAPPRRQGVATVDGMVNGAPFHAADAAVFFGALSRRDAGRRGIRIVLGTSASACATADAHAIRGSFELEMGREKLRGTFDATNYDARREPALSIRCER